MSAIEGVDTLSCVGQGTETLFQLGIVFNRAEADSFQQRTKHVAMRSPVKLLSPGSDSSDDMDADNDIFER